MIVIDANLLLYAYDQESPFHASAREWLERVFSGPETVGIPWTVVLAFLRIMSNSRARSEVPAIKELIETVNEWAARRIVTFVNPGPRHWEILRDVLASGQARGPLVTDAHL